MTVEEKSAELLHTKPPNPDGKTKEENQKIFDKLVDRKVVNKKNLSIKNCQLKSC